MVDEGLEKVQEKDNVGQKLHKTPPFVDGWIKTRLGVWTFKQLQTAESFPLLLKPPYGIIDSEADENKNADCFWQSAMATIFI